MSLRVGVDVGGTTSTIAIGDSDGNVLRVSDQFRTRSGDGPQATVADIVDQIETEVASLGQSADQVVQICLATPGPATLDGVLLKTPNLDPQLWDQTPIRELLQQGFADRVRQVPVVYLGDGQAAGLGEFSALTQRVKWSAIDADSTDQEIRSLFFVAVGTGLGGGEVRDGQAVQGNQGRAGHAGHLLLPRYAFRYEEDAQRWVGNAQATAESAISLTALTHQLQYRLGLPKWKDHPLHQVTGTPKDRAKQLRELAAQSDPLAIELFEDQAKALGILLLMIHYLGDYDRLVIGGGVAEMSTDMRDRYLRLVKESYHQHALDGFRDFDSIFFTVCGDNASVLGALAHALGPVAD